jgi:pimeloyl-ACP methyl ester carboxylesterase
VRNFLVDLGTEVVAVDLPLTSFRDDVKCVHDAIASAAGEVVLCGHSYGGSVITQAGTEDRVVQLVYLCAFVPSLGGSTMNPDPEGELRVAPHEELDPMRMAIEDGVVTLSDREDAIHRLLPDCPPDIAKVTADRFRTMGLDCLAAPVDETAWRDKPSFYLVCTEDGGIAPAVQAAFADRCEEKAEWVSGHYPFLHNPEGVADILNSLVARQSGVR